MTFPNSFAALTGAIDTTKLDQNFSAIEDTTSAVKGAALVGYSPTRAYGSNTLGSRLNEELTTSGFASLQAAVTAAAGKRLRVVGTWTITAAVTVSSNTEIVIDAGATIQTATADIILLDCTSKTNVTIRGPGTIKNTATGTTSGSGTIGLVSFNGATDCTIEGVKLIGQTWAGILMNGSTRCAALRNVITSAVGTLQDSADILLYNNATQCVVQGNWCLSGSEHGIMLQDPYAGLLPAKNIISNNIVGQHTGYGIVAYLPGSSGSGDTNNEIIGNYVENIQGSYSTNRSSGNGIYVVGVYAGGTKIIGNTVVNCCVQTNDRALAPAGIGVNGIPTGVTRPILADNSISGMTQGDGINISSSAGGAVISGGTVTIPSGNNGSGAGGATLLGSGIRIENSSNVSITAPDVVVAGTGYGVLLYANGASMSDISIGGPGTVQSGSGAPFVTVQSGGSTISNLTAIGFRCKTTSDTPNAVSLQSVVGGTVSLNASCGTSGSAQAALNINGCTQLQVIGGKYISTATVQVATTGTCTGGFLSRAAYWGTAASGMNNAGTGFNVEFLTTAVPASGTWARGDHWIQRDSSSGAAPGGYCTTAGTPGTWKAEANLA